jgi:hypothetical protein
MRFNYSRRKSCRCGRGHAAVVRASHWCPFLAPISSPAIARVSQATAGRMRVDGDGLPLV